jgi:hypothetical protein
MGAIFGFLLLIYARYKNSEDLKLASYWSFVIIALITILVFIAGLNAEETVEKLPNVTDSLIEHHEHAAEQAFIALELLGAVSLAGIFLLRGDKNTPNWFGFTVLALAFIAATVVSFTGILGGIIRHTEVRGELKFLMPKEEQQTGSIHPQKPGDVLAKINLFN